MIPVKFSQLILMFKLNTLQVMISEIKDANRRELESLGPLGSFVGGTEQNAWTRQTVNGQRILAERSLALADAVAAKVNL